METALVTGAAGFIGSRLVERLVERGVRVRGLDDCSSGSREALESVWTDERFAFHEGDIRDERALERALEDTDVVFHMAAETSVPDSVERPGRTTSINTTGTARVLSSARDRDLRVVFASSAAVYGPDAPVPTGEDAPLGPTSPYGLSKRYGEGLLEQLGVDGMALRYFNVYGPGQKPTAVVPIFLERMRRGERPIIYGDGGQTRDFVHVRDIVRATIAAGERDATGVCNVGSGGRVSIDELVDSLNDLLGTTLDPVYESARPGDIRHSGADISRARDLLEYEPTVNLSEGLETMVDSD